MTPLRGESGPLHDRRKAREEIEPEDHPILVLDKQGNYRLGEDRKPRSAYDSELFAGNIAQDGKKIEEPPKPYKSSGGCTFKLNRLLRAWIDGDGDLDALSKERRVRQRKLLAPFIVHLSNSKQRKSPC